MDTSRCAVPEYICWLWFSLSLNHMFYGNLINKMSWCRTYIFTIYSSKSLFLHVSRWVYSELHEMYFSKCLFFYTCWNNNSLDSVKLARKFIHQAILKLFEWCIIIKFPLNIDSSVQAFHFSVLDDLWTRDSHRKKEIQEITHD